MVNNQKTYAPTVSQNTLLQPKTNKTFTFTAEQLTKLVANVAIQIAQVCYPNPKQDTLDLKSSMCRKISNATKTILNVEITAKNLFESIGSRWTELARRWVTWRIRPIRFNFVCLPVAGKFQLQQLDHCLHFPWILHWISRRSQVPMMQRAKKICLDPFT